MRWQVKALIQSILARVPYGEAINHALRKRNPAKDDASRLTDITASLGNLLQLRWGPAGTRCRPFGPRRKARAK